VLSSLTERANTVVAQKVDEPSHCRTRCRDNGSSEEPECRDGPGVCAGPPNASDADSPSQKGRALVLSRKGTVIGFNDLGLDR
jgi:hypothetical protein